MASFFEDNADLRWYFTRGLDWDALVRVTEHVPLEGPYAPKDPDAPKTTAEAKELFGDIARAIGELAGNTIAPHAAEIDRAGVIFENGEARFPPRLEAVSRAVSQMELHGLCLPRELGGMNAPMALYYLTSEVLARADVSVMAHHGFHGGMALAMLLFSMREGSTTLDAAGRITKTRFEKEIREIVAGEAWGCMDITEPDAGSDMAKLRARGVLGSDGVWRVTGQKIFITSGHGKYHFVIARTETVGAERSAATDDPMAGLQGLSMFLVPTYEDLPDGTRRRIVSLDRVEEKLGHHASVTAALSFDDAPAHLIGERGQGFEYMLLLMNGARVGVGFECIGLCEASIRLAEGYARERTSMGKTIDRHEMIADYLDEMRTDVRGLRALAAYATFHEEMGQKLDLRRRVREQTGQSVDTELARTIRRHRKKARRATPLLKYLAAEKAVEMARRCIQIHGGVGYTTEYGAEKLLRDALVMPIYEGTSQIQSLMAMKDTLGAVMKNPRGFVQRSADARVRALSSRDALERRVARLQIAADDATRLLIVRTAGDKLRSVRDQPIGAWVSSLSKNWNPKRDFAFAMLHAERLTRILCDVMIAEVLLEQRATDAARGEILEAWLERAEPRCRFLLDEIQTRGQRVLDQLASDETATARAAE
ncbi:MAG: acyl-CoA dehydrogenase family protein [Deltaproteobacteria bacterium]|nr:acyl-CoA dehydrogenase family protein [Deltaproteobacteria bacterium]